MDPMGIIIVISVGLTSLNLPAPRLRFGPVGPETVDGSAPRWRVNGQFFQFATLKKTKG
jgi:hypothetical protein